MRIDSRARHEVVALLAFAHVGDLVAPGGPRGFVEGGGEGGAGGFHGLVGAEGVEFVFVAFLEGGCWGGEGLRGVSGGGFGCGNTYCEGGDGEGCAGEVGTELVDAGNVGIGKGGRG